MIDRRNSFDQPVKNGLWTYDNIREIATGHDQNNTLQLYDWWKKLFDQTVKNGLWTNDNISEIATGQSNDYTTVRLLDYPYFEEYYVLIWIDLIKQQKLNANPEAMQQTNFTVNLDRARNTQMFSIIGEAKEIVLDFSKWTKKILKFSFFLIQ